ncbi:hypothetical protein [Streptomyces sp. NPDC004528]|uniref:hypothetical protein n=1 Tax=Streptomyces sp. NPDC004528 TaxID=3154550 RepID=UPI0033BD92D2
MILPGDRLDIVLDVFTEDDAYRVVFAGALRPGQPVPSVPAGATRNVVQTWLEVPHTVRAFALHLAAAEEQPVEGECPYARGIRTAIAEMKRDALGVIPRLERMAAAADQADEAQRDKPTAGGHVYLSTGCLHGDHAYCQNEDGRAGPKRPGECKHCGTRCICSCHLRQLQEGGRP